MNSLDLVVFLVAGVIGAFGTPRFAYSNQVAWGIVGVWALLKLLRVF